MDLDALMMFLEVVRTGSFLSAANSLTVARPTLRRRVEELEARAGVPLLVRTRQGVVPTEAGKLLAAKAQGVIDEAKSLVGLVREVGSENKGRLRVAVPVGVPPHTIGPLLALMHATYPQIGFDISFAADPLSLIGHGADVVLTLGGDAPPESWVSYDVLDVPEQLFASSTYLREHGTPQDTASLTGHRLLAWAPPDGDPRVWPDGQGGELDVEPWLTSDDIFAVRSAAAMGLGIAFVPNADLPIPPPAPEDLVRVLPEVSRARRLRVFVPLSLVESPRIRGTLSIIEKFWK